VVGKPDRVTPPCSIRELSRSQSVCDVRGSYYSKRWLLIIVRLNVRKHPHPNIQLPLILQTLCEGNSRSGKA